MSHTDALNQLTDHRSRFDADSLAADQTETIIIPFTDTDNYVAEIYPTSAWQISDVSDGLLCGAIHRTSCLALTAGRCEHR